MSDRFGLLTLPMTEVGDPDVEAVGDPMLDVLGAFLKAAVNADVGAGWRVANPISPLPITTIQTHNPDKSRFTDSELPCLFLYRISWPKLTPYSQEWKASVSQVAALWVPDLAEVETDAARDPMRNAVARAIHRNIERGRNPAWIVEGDDDPKTADYGSFLLSFLNVTKIQVLDIKPMPLMVQRAQKDYPYDGLLATLEVTEVLEPLLDDYPEAGSLNGSFALGEDPLTFVSFELRPTIVSVTPSTGPTAGGTAITISGRQFFESDDLDPIAVTVDDVACTSVVFVDENTITATTPAGSAGAKTVKVTLPNGTSASLASAFTFA